MPPGRPEDILHPRNSILKHKVHSSHIAAHSLCQPTNCKLVNMLDLTSSPIITIVGCLLIAAELIHRVWIWYRLSHIPGPFWGSFSRIWMFRVLGKGRFGEDLADVCDKYGRFPVSWRWYPVNALLTLPTIQALWPGLDQMSWSRMTTSWFGACVVPGLVMLEISRMSPHGSIRRMIMLVRL